MLDLLFGLFLTGYASWEDWKTTEVPDWLTQGGVGLALVARLGYSGYTGEWSYLTAGLIGFSLMFLIGCALYYTSQWGGGDAKLLMALGATLGINISLSFEQAISQEMIAFGMNLAIVGGLYGLIYALCMAYNNKAKVANRMKKHLATDEAGQAKLASYLGCAGFLILAFFMPSFTKPLFFALAFTMILGFYLWNFTKSVEDAAMIKFKSPNELMEGDWILDTIKHKGKEIVSPKDLGITLQQIATLKRLKIKKVKMKEGIPFCPAFFFAYLVTLFFGNFFVWLRYAI